MLEVDFIIFYMTSICYVVVNVTQETCSKCTYLLWFIQLTQNTLGMIIKDLNEVYSYVWIAVYGKSLPPKMYFTQGYNKMFLKYKNPW